jgi:prepilin-type processing-associated H-X9-DG protein
MGMAMVDAIFDKGQLGRGKGGEGGDWGELLRILVAGQVSGLDRHGKRAAFLYADSQ